MLPSTACSIITRKPLGLRGKTRGSLLRLDKRTRLHRRIQELIAVYRESVALDGRDPDAPLTAVRVEKAAELAAVAELARARFVAGELTCDDVVRAERIAALSLKALRIPDRPAKPAAPSLADYLAAKREAGA